MWLAECTASRFGDLWIKKGVTCRFFIGKRRPWATLAAINGRDRWRFSMTGDGQKRQYAEDELSHAMIQAAGLEFVSRILSVLPSALTTGRGANGTNHVFIAGGHGPSELANRPI